MSDVKRVTGAEWVADTAALMRDHDLVEIVDADGVVRSVYSCPAALEDDCEECEEKDATIVRLTTERDDVARRVVALTLALARCDAQAKTINSAHSLWFARRMLGHADREIASMAKICAAALAIHEQCRVALGSPEPTRPFAPTPPQEDQ